MLAAVALRIVPVGHGAWVAVKRVGACSIVTLGRSRVGLRDKLNSWILGSISAERGGKNAKKRAVIAVARKVAVLLHKLWVSGEVYEPLRNNHKVVSAVA